jgi:hypothetical protein
MTEKFRKIIDKFFYPIIWVFIVAIVFVIIILAKQAMASTIQCEYSNPVNLGTDSWQYQLENCTTTEATTSTEIFDTYDVDFNGTTSKLYFSNYWTAGDIIVVFSIFAFMIFSIATKIIGIFVKKYVSINRKNQ